MSNDEDENTACVVQVEGLTKRYGDLAAVDDVSFSIRAGEAFGILGPNGAGKTTTLECIEGLLTPTSGAIRVLGMDIGSDAERIKRRIGVQLQASAYFDYLTLREILELFARVYDSDTRAEELLATVGLEDRANTTVAKLSGGQQQRFAIAATLVNDPDIVFLDEPTAGLDAHARRGLWEFVRGLNSQGRTVVLTTHYIEEAEMLCDRVAIMDEGRMVALDTPLALKRRIPAPFTFIVGLGEGDSAAGLESLDAVAGVSRLSSGGTDGVLELRSSDSTRTAPALMSWLSDTGATLTRFEVASSTLEDVFISLTGRQIEDQADE